MSKVQNYHAGLPDTTRQHAGLTWGLKLVASRFLTSYCLIPEAANEHRQYPTQRGLADTEGLEPPTIRLTAGCSAIEPRASKEINGLGIKP